MLTDMLNLGIYMIFNRSTLIAKNGSIRYFPLTLFDLYFPP
jgi:hypothetical protein